MQVMERPHRVIEKKLHELEMLFGDLFFPPSNSINPSDQERLSKEIVARVDFLRNLLSIEKECHLQGKDPSRLTSLEERLDGIYTAFHDWMENGELPKKDVPGDFSVCYCTRSCFSGEDDDDEEEEEGGGGKADEKEKDQEEEGVDMPESECFELETKKNSIISDMERFDQEKSDGDLKQLPGCHRRYFPSFFRFVVMVGAVAALVAGANMMISEVIAGFEDDVIFVPT